MEPTLDAALSKIFRGTVSTAAAPPAPGPAPGAAPPPQTGALAADLKAQIREANQHYERAQQLLRQGDLGGYGEEIKKLGEVLKQLAGSSPPERKKEAGSRQ
jgi:uncharacterized membrane protein (UPF0182 family)